MKFVILHVDSTMDKFATPIGWRYWVFLILRLRLGNRRLIGVLEDGSLICHPDNMAIVKKELLERGYKVRVYIPKPKLVRK